jgi:hypothetical protein
VKEPTTNVATHVYKGRPHTASQVNTALDKLFFFLGAHMSTYQIDICTALWQLVVVSAPHIPPNTGYSPSSANSAAIDALTHTSPCILQATKPEYTHANVVDVETNDECKGKASGTCVI